MTRPRSALIDREEGGFYHLGSRCVRRAALCGQDPHSGRNLSHRRAWVENRLLVLAEVFTVYVYAYAVMSNHYHITADYRPQERLDFTDEEVASRWLRLFPPSPADDFDQRFVRLVDDPERLAVLRDHLGDLSWYLRCLNEPIARRANREDNCTGRFWQGRSSTKALDSERAVWACMAYDDLNPLRAGMAHRVDDSEYTSLQRRMEEAAKDPKRLDEPLAPLVRDAHQVGSARPAAPAHNMTLREYRAHVEWTGCRLHEPPVAAGRGHDGQLGDPTSWLALVASCRQRSHAPK